MARLAEDGVRPVRVEPSLGKRATAFTIAAFLLVSVATVQQSALAAPSANTQTSRVMQDRAEHVRTVSPAEMKAIQAAARATGDGCGSSCDKKDPATYKNYYSGCSTCYYYCSDDAYTVYDAPDVPSGPWVELRYSPRCQTAWSRAGSAWTPEIISYYMSGSRRTSAGRVGSTTWSKMVNDHDLLAEACAYDGPTTVCTRKY